MVSYAEMIVEKVTQELKKQLMIEVEASGRHVHLSNEDLEKLFGAGYELTKVRDLSQPGQYVCMERVNIIGPKKTFSNVVVLGPTRKDSQVEISMTDALALGIKVPVRQSGEVANTPGITISHNDKKIELQQGVIVAKRHIHMTPEDAKKRRVQDGDCVKLKVFGTRPVIFEDTVVRVSDRFQTRVHLDYDEANACGYQEGTYGVIWK